MDAKIKRFSICIPVFNDYPSANALVVSLDRELTNVDNVNFEVLLVDDGSSKVAEAQDLQTKISSFTAITSVSILNLKRNVGHQRAIALGLCHLESEVKPDAVIVMDGDGEDTPEGTRKLVDMFLAGDGETAVFAKRGRRSESLGFRVGYACFKLGHRIMTGRAVEVGNFSIVPASALGALVCSQDLWNHYAAAFFHARLPKTLLEINRGHRIAGRSQMNYTGLVSHGLGSIAVFLEDIAARSILAGFMAGGIGLGIATLAAVAWYSQVPGVPTFVYPLVIVLLLLILQMVVFSVIFGVSVLNSRSSGGFLPVRDWKYYVGEKQTLEAGS